MFYLAQLQMSDQIHSQGWLCGIVSNLVMQVLIPKTFYYGFVSSLMSIFNNSSGVHSVWCDFDDENKV